MARFLVYVVLSLTLGACAPTVTLRTLPVHTDFSVPAGKAVIYLYRDEEFGGAVPLKVSVNDVAIGKTTGKTFFRLVVKPGTYLINSESESPVSLQLITENGKNYYVWQEVNMGMMSPKIRLHLVDLSEGQAGVKASNYLNPLNSIDN